MADTLTRIANEVLQATEEISLSFEEGLAVLLSGKTNEGAAQQQFVGDDEDFEMSEEELLMMSSPLGGMAEGVIEDIMSNQARPETFWEHLEAFRSAITWSEPFIISLLTFHVVTFLVVLYISRKNGGFWPRIITIGTIGILVRTAEYTNGIAGRNWRSFATQNYFDHQGIFVAIMFSAPLMFNCLLMLIFYIREASQLLVKVKRMEIKRKAKALREENKKSKNDTKTESSKPKGD